MREVKKMVTDELINEIKESLYCNIIAQYDVYPSDYKYEDVDDMTKYNFNILPEIKNIIYESLAYDIEYTVNDNFEGDNKEICNYIEENYENEIVNYVLNKIECIINNPDDDLFFNFIDKYDYMHIECSDNIESILNNINLEEIKYDSEEYDDIRDDLFEMSSNTDYVSHSDYEIEAGIVTFNDVNYIYLENSYNKNMWYNEMIYFSDDNEITNKIYEKIKSEIIDLINSNC